MCKMDIGILSSSSPPLGHTSRAVVPPGLVIPQFRKHIGG